MQPGRAAALVAAAGLAMREGLKYARWALIHTYECAAWLADVDTRLAAAPPAPGAGPHHAAGPGAPRGAGEAGGPGDPSG